MNTLAPIVIFTYRRLGVNSLINSLMRNKLSKDSDLIIFSDNSKDQKDREDVANVRKFLKTINGFKSTKIIESETNKGLARSVIDGVTKVVNEYGKVIVLEDDLVVSSRFLEFMNKSLEFYKSNQKIWSITGYGPNLPSMDSYHKDIYLSVRGSSWSWATWNDRWDKIDWDIKDFNVIKNSYNIKVNFNRGGNDLYKMLELQMLGKIDSWAIRWVYNQFKLGMYTVYPKNTQISNNGVYDGKSTHNNMLNEKWIVQIDNEPINIAKVELENDMVEKFRLFYNLSFTTSISYFLRKNGLFSIVNPIYRLMKEGLK